jgi:HEAT repeat protein
MVIKASASSEIRALVEALSDADEVRREAAIARLAVIGSRAVDRLLRAFAGTSDRETRATILRALECTGDRRAAPAARQGLEDGGTVAIAAASVLRALLDSPHGSVASEALDALVAVALDVQAERRVRIAAFEALDGIPADVRAEIARTIDVDGQEPVRRSARESSVAAAGDGVWTDALAGRLPENPDLLGRVVALRGATAPLGVLQKLIDEVRRMESDPRGGARGDEWRLVRGALHQTLARRGSRVALYDLRESFEAAGTRLPVSFLAALQAVGDSSCLEPLAATLSSTASDDDWWRSRLAEAFRTIAKREKITRRHAMMRRIIARWPQTPARVAAKADPPSSS